MLRGSVTVTRPDEVDVVSNRLVGLARQARYVRISRASGAPQAWIAASFEREAGSDFSLSPAQGDP